MSPETSLLTSDPLLHNLPLESGQTALTPLSQSLCQVLEQRRSERLFSSRPVPAPVLAQLLWAACGVNRQETGQRTAPSAKNWQEIDIYVAREDGLFLFEPAAGALRQLGQRDVRAATGWQDFVAGASVNLVYVADLAKIDHAPAGSKNSMPRSTPASSARMSTCSAPRRASRPWPAPGWTARCWRTSWGCGTPSASYWRRRWVFPVARHLRRP